MNDLRSTAAVLTSKINNMCNATNMDDLVAEFTSAKDLIIKLFQDNVNRLQK